jgi:hypothetical protein
MNLDEGIDGNKGLAKMGIIDEPADRKEGPGRCGFDGEVEWRGENGKGQKKGTEKEKKEKEMQFRMPFFHADCAEVLSRNGEEKEW